MPPREPKDKRFAWRLARPLRKCTLLAGDVLFVPQFWSLGFESSNGESVSVTGRITWK